MQDMSASAAVIVAMVTIVMTSTLVVEGARILMVVCGMNSHVTMFARLGGDLSQLGHNVTLVAPDNVRIPDFVPPSSPPSLQHLEKFVDKSATTTTDHRGEFTLRTFPSDDQMPYVNSREYSDMLVEMVLTDSAWNRRKRMFKSITRLFAHWNAEGRRLLTNDEIMSELRRADFDFAIIDPIASTYALPISLNVSYGLLSIGAFHFTYRVPRLSSFSTAMGNAYFHDRLAFHQRLANFVHDMTGITFASLRREKLFLDDDDSIIDGLPNDWRSLDTTDGFLGSSLWFIVEDPLVGYPRPLMPTRSWSATSCQVALVNPCRQIWNDSFRSRQFLATMRPRRSSFRSAATSATCHPP